MASPGFPGPQAKGSAMQCRNCKGTISNQAADCPFCGKKQPKPPSAKTPGLVLISILAILVVGRLVTYSPQTPAQDEQYRLQAASVCNGNMTVEQIQASAKLAAAKSHISLAAATRSAEVEACPTMKDN
jgi:hypothetical protein